MPDQITNTILMIRPVAFGMNEETQVNNYFQHATEGMSPDQIQDQALQEFDEFVKLLRENKLDVVVIEDTPTPSTPDSIFPNNWISFHENGEIITYPMFAPNRRLERRRDILLTIRNQFVVSQIKDFSPYEKRGQFLEGTGSLVLDRQNMVAFVSMSERTMPSLLAEFERMIEFECVAFHSFHTVNGVRMPIYHTNVMMYVGEEFVVICLLSIDDPTERENVKSHLYRTGKEIIEINEDQVAQFAGNGLQVVNNQGEKLIVMSTAAFTSLTIDQINQLAKHGRIIHSMLETIELFGGGSARCMMAEVFLQRNT